LQPEINEQALAAYRMRAAANQFYWIAGLSLVNLLLLVLNASVMFPTGLAMADLLAALSYDLELIGRIATALGALGVVGLFAVLGYYGKRGLSWALIAGISLYVLDAVIWGFVGDWISAGFHALILFFIVRDLTAKPRRAF
jgi:hypothetical protein